ncbi:MAG: hypothetical protein SFX18_10795 [Pirellulales bacterium]|nr:hypothetical protein [Pirellulales bacterium]
MKLALRSLPIGFLLIMLVCGSAHTELPAATESEISASSAIPWKTNLREAQQLATVTRQPVVLYFYLPGTAPTTRCEDTILRHADVHRQLTKQAIPVRINVRDVPYTARHFQATDPAQLPLIVVQSPTQQELLRLTIPDTGAALAKLLQPILEPAANGLASAETPKADLAATPSPTKQPATSSSTTLTASPQPAKPATPAAKNADPEDATLPGHIATTAPEKPKTTPDPATVRADTSQTAATTGVQDTTVVKVSQVVPSTGPAITLGSPQLSNQPASSLFPLSSQPISRAPAANFQYPANPPAPSPVAAVAATTAANPKLTPAAVEANAPHVSPAPPMSAPPQTPSGTGPALTATSLPASVVPVSPAQPAATPAISGYAGIDSIPFQPVVGGSIPPRGVSASPAVTPPATNTPTVSSPVASAGVVASPSNIVPTGNSGTTAGSLPAAQPPQPSPPVLPHPLAITAQPPFSNPTTASNTPPGGLVQPLVSSVNPIRTAAAGPPSPAISAYSTENYEKYLGQPLTGGSPQPKTTTSSPVPVPPGPASLAIVPPASAASPVSSPLAVAVPSEITPLGPVQLPPVTTGAATLNPPRNKQEAAGSPQHLALDGYCPVTLLDHRKLGSKAWVKGNLDFGVVHRGRTYLFAGKEQQQKFLLSPDKYSPALYGHDPVYLAQQGHYVLGKREYGLCVGERMFLFANAASLKEFQTHQEQYLTLARQAELPAGTSLR